MRMKLPWLPMMTKRFSKPGHNLKCQRAQCCSLTPTRIIHPVASTLSRCSVIFQMLSLVAAQFLQCSGPVGNIPHLLPLTLVF